MIRRTDDSPLPAVLVRRTTRGVLCVPPELGQATASAVPSFFELLHSAPSPSPTRLPEA